MTHGKLTAAVAHALLDEYKSGDFEVLYDHGQVGVDPAENLGKIRSWFGPKYAASTVLADLDIAIVSRQTDRAIALIEIEETTSRPKVILGDALAILLGSHIKFQGKRDLLVGPWTTLIILTRATKSVHLDSIAFLQQKVDEVRVKLSTSNANIGRVIIDSFYDEVDLEQKLSASIKAAVTSSIAATRNR